MKLSFSTLGCPKLSFRDVLSIAKDLGYDGIELRGIMQTIDAPDLKEFSQENCPQTMERLNKLGLEIPILTSACKLHREEKWEATLALAKRYVDTAARIGTKYVRVLGDSNPAPSKIRTDPKMSRTTTPVSTNCIISPACPAILKSSGTSGAALQAYFCILIYPTIDIITKDRPIPKNVLHKITATKDINKNINAQL